MGQQQGRRQRVASPRVGLSFGSIDSRTVRARTATTFLPTVVSRSNAKVEKKLGTPACLFLTAQYSLSKKQAQHVSAFPTKREIGVVIEMIVELIKLSVERTQINNAHLKTFALALKMRLHFTIPKKKHSHSTSSKTKKTNKMREHGREIIILISALLNGRRKITHECAGERWWWWFVHLFFFIFFLVLCNGSDLHRYFTLEERKKCRHIERKDIIAKYLFSQHPCFSPVYDILIM